MTQFQPNRGGFLHGLWVLVLLGMLPLSSQAQELSVVLSSNLSPYIEAFDGVQKAWGRALHRIDLRDDQAPTLPSETRVVITIGGQAALASYPSHVMVIYCLAPGVVLNKQAIKIAMTPSATEIIKRLKVVQPTLRRLGIFWASDAQESFLKVLHVAAQQWGIELITKRVGGIGDLSNGLRSVLRDGVDGLWLPPDPVLINARSFGIFREFSYANDVPLYVPSSGLLEKGAVASISSNFHHIGQTAGEVAHQILIGDQLPVIVYPERVTFWVNLNAALATSVTVNLDALERNGGEVRE